MSLPNNRLTTTCVENDFLDPDSIIRATRTIDYEKGGVALNNSSQGLRVKNWVLKLVGNDVTLYPQDDELDVVTVLSEAGITEVSLAFDQNMQPVVGYIAGGVAKLRWFNAGTSAYVTTEVSASAISIFLTLDDKRNAATEGNLNDVLVFYASDSNLYYRQQRDLYGVERNPYTFSGTNDTFIRRAGFMSGYRVGVELYALPSLPECGPDFIVSVNGTSPLTGASVTVQQQAIGSQEAYASLQSERCVFVIPPGVVAGLGSVVCYNTLMTVGMGTITAVLSDRTVSLAGVALTAYTGTAIAPTRSVALTGASTTVSRGSLTVSLYPDLPSFAISEIQIFGVGTTAGINVAFNTDGTRIITDQNGNVRDSGTWIDTTQTNYVIADISHLYRVVAINVFVGTPSSSGANYVLSSPFVITAQNLTGITILDFQITIAPTTNNPRYGETYYFGTHRIRARLLEAI